MFGIRLKATICKECYFDRLVIKLGMFIIMDTWPKICYVLSITLSPLLLRNIKVSALVFGTGRHASTCYVRRQYHFMTSKKINNDQELIQSDQASCPQNQKGNN